MCNHQARLSRAAHRCCCLGYCLCCDNLGWNDHNALQHSEILSSANGLRSVHGKRMLVKKFLLVEVVGGLQLATAKSQDSLVADYYYL